MTKRSRTEISRRWLRLSESFSLSGLLSSRPGITQGTERDPRSDTDIASSSIGGSTHIDRTVSVPGTPRDQSTLNDQEQSIPGSVAIASTFDASFAAEPGIDDPLEVSRPPTLLCKSCTDPASYIKGTPFADLLDFMHEKEVFGKLGINSEQAQAFRRNFVTGLQNVYKEKHLAREAPRNSVKSYDFQVDGLVIQEVCISALRDTKTTVFYFTIHSELSGEKRHSLPLKQRFQEQVWQLQNNGYSGYKPIAIMRILKTVKFFLDDFLQPESSDGGAAWAITRDTRGGRLDSGYGVIADGEEEGPSC